MGAIEGNCILSTIQIRRDNCSQREQETFFFFSTSHFSSTRSRYPDIVYTHTPDPVRAFITAALCKTNQRQQSLFLYDPLYNGNKFLYQTVFLPNYGHLAISLSSIRIKEDVLLKYKDDLGFLDISGGRLNKDEGRSLLFRRFDI